VEFRRFPERNVSLLSLLGTRKSDHVCLWKWSSGGISPEKEVAFLSMGRNSSFPPGSEQEALTKCSRKTRPHSSCCWCGTRFLSPHETVPVYGFLGQDDGSLSAGKGTAMAFKRPSEDCSPDLQRWEKNVEVLRKTVSTTSTKPGKPSTLEYQRLRKEFRNTRYLVFGQRRRLAGISTKRHP